MCYKFNYMFYAIILLINIKYLKTFNVNFHYNYNLQIEPFNTQIQKRESTQFYDKASFSFVGFEKVESIPVLFPIDICVLSVDDSKYAITLHMKINGTRHFEVLKMNNGSYELIADIPSPNGIAIDCINFNNKGYVALALNVTEPIQYANKGSPIYEIVGNRIRSVQYFAAPNLTSVHLRVSGNDFFLLQTYANSPDIPNIYCPYFKWSGSTFNKLGRIPCSNARQVTPFSIDYESYVAVANYADQKGRTSTNSEIFKYSHDKKKFVLFQKIQTNGAVDVQYFNVVQNEMRMQNFLVFGNSANKDSLSKGDANNLDADSIFYIFDKGQFVPFQKLSLYAVKQFLPIQNVEPEKFILLISCTDQDIKIYNFNAWKFEESKVQFTEGALGKGVANMRTYNENGKSYLIIANNLMADNEANIFLPIFKQEEHANTLRQKIIDWAKAEVQRLEIFNTQDLIKQVDIKLKKLEQMKYFFKMEDVQQANIQTVTTESLVYPKLKMYSDYWLALNYVSKALDALEVMLKEKQRIKRNTVSWPNSYDNLEYVYDTLKVQKIIVNKNLKAKIINKVNCSKPEFENIKAQKIIVKDKYIKLATERVNPMESTDNIYRNESMTVKNLQIAGKLNEYLWSRMFADTLKRQEEMQFLRGAIEIKSLKTDTIVVNNDKVNEQDLGALIPVVGGKYVINQDIQFAAPVTADQLQIFERLNNLHVFNGKFDVLLKKSNKTQVIKGLKNVTNIKVMEPITISGKMIGHQLEAILPNKFIHKPLILQGNFIVNGDVHINHNLSTLDLIDLKENLSTKQVLDMGIRMDKTLDNVNLKFQQPLVANNSLVSFANRHDLQRLVKLNQDDIQVVEGVKVFNDSLTIGSGFSEVKNLNGLDLETLESNSFLKNNNQTIKLPLKIGKISAKSILSPNILLNRENLSNYLTITGNQSIEGSLTLQNLKVDILTAEHLNTDNQIFNKKLQDIYQQKSHNAPQNDVLKPNRKFHGSIYVHNLILNSTINNKPIRIIENQILQLEGNIKYVGNFKFNYPMNVTNVTFQGKLNDISAEDFGKCWLKKRSNKQIFTSSQTFATVNAEKGTLLQGKLNGFTMEDFYTKTYWTNRNEYIPCASFENPFEITTYLTTKSLNNYMVPDDVFYKNYKENPAILKSISVNENFIVEGSILKLASINNIELSKLVAFLDNTGAKHLYVDNAYFLQSAPLYKTLNKRNIRNTLNSVWLSNENVMLPHYIEISYANFEGLLEFVGHINDMNLDYLKENYFSKTRIQDVSVVMIFPQGAESENDIYLNEMQVFGPITEENSGISLIFDDFVKNTLKTLGPNIISGDWSASNIIVQGNLNNVLITQLALKDDILLSLKNTKNYEIKAPKTFKSLHIENIFVDSSSLVNRVPVKSWIMDSVYLYENFTIKGVTTIESVNVYNDLIIVGKLSNITFNEHNVLLKDKNQQIGGNVHIVSHYGEEKRFLTNNIENLYADYINHQYMPTFMKNIITVAGTSIINSHLIFKNALKVERYSGSKELSIQNEYSKHNVDAHTKLNRQATHSSGGILRDLVGVKEYLHNITKNMYKLGHFGILQTIGAKSAELILLSLKFNTLIVDVLAVSDIQDKKVEFFVWMPKEKQFFKTKEFDWLPHDPLLLEIIRQRFVALEEPIETNLLKDFIRQELNMFHNVLSNTTNIHRYFEFSNKTCIQFQSTVLTFLELKFFCLNTPNQRHTIKSNENVQQIKKFGQKYVAVLTDSSVLVYDTTSNSNNTLQKIAITSPKEMALGMFENFQFLAVLNWEKSDTFNYGFVEIYRSVNSSTFRLFQSLKHMEPVRIEFSFIKKSNDFFIHVLTGSIKKPFSIYQYQGVMGFREILSDSILPANSLGFNILNVYSTSHNLVAFIGQNNITLLELYLNQV